MQSLNVGAHIGQCDAPAPLASTDAAEVDTEVAREFSNRWRGRDFGGGFYGNFPGQILLLRGLQRVLGRPRLGRFRRAGNRFLLLRGSGFSAARLDCKDDLADGNFVPFLDSDFGNFARNGGGDRRDGLLILKFNDRLPLGDQVPFLHENVHHDA